MMSKLMTVRKQSVLDISCGMMKGMNEKTQRQVKKLRNDKHRLAGKKKLVIQKAKPEPEHRKQEADIRETIDNLTKKNAKALCFR